MFIEKVNKSKTKLLDIINENDFHQIIVGFSGGKDSTCVVQLLIDTVIENELDLPIKILSSDTLIENPLISVQIKNMHSQINEISKKYDLDLETLIVKPILENTFFYKSILMGYATPLNTKGRWCTRTLKVDPMESIYKNIDQKSLLLTGVRRDESSSRKNNIDNMLGKDDFTETKKNIFSFPIIKDWKLSDVWDYLMDIVRNDDYMLETSKLWEIYRDGTTDDVCPSSMEMLVENNSNGCGKSRYGCFMCPLVAKDKSLEANIANGRKDLIGYNELRKYYIERCYDPKYRDRMNRRGQCKLKKVEFNKEKSKISYKLLSTYYYGNISEFNVINAKDSDEALEKIKLGTATIKNPFPKKSIFEHDKKEVLFKINGDYFAPMTGRLSLEFRYSLLLKILEIENKYKIIILSIEERRVFMEWLSECPYNIEKGLIKNTILDKKAVGI